MARTVSMQGRLLGQATSLSVPITRLGRLYFVCAIALLVAPRYVERSTTFELALEMFRKQPLFGCGWGADFNYSIATQMLANVGLVGSAAFLLAVGATLIASQSAWRSTDGIRSHLLVYAEAAENAFVVYLMESVVSGFKYVVADFWCLWAFAIAIPSCLVSIREATRTLAASTGARDRSRLPLMAGVQEDQVERG